MLISDGIEKIFEITMAMANRRWYDYIVKNIVITMAMTIVISDLFSLFPDATMISWNSSWSRWRWPSCYLFDHDVPIITIELSVWSRCSDGIGKIIAIAMRMTIVPLYLPSEHRNIKPPSPMPGSDERSWCQFRSFSRSEISGDFDESIYYSNKCSIVYAKKKKNRKISGNKSRLFQS